MPESIGWRAYGGLVGALSLLHYGILSHFGPGDEGGLAWFRRRLNPQLPDVPEGRVWIHAVSAGESKVALLLAEALHRTGAAMPVLVSSTTYSGAARIAVADPGLVAPFVMPLDTPAAQRRVFETLKPSLLVLVESEFWPAQFSAAETAGVPVVVVNAMMSETSLARHRRFPALTRATVLKARMIYPQESETAARFRQLGVSTERIEVTGNLKLAGARLASEAGTRPFVTFGNVHRAEIAALAPAVREIAHHQPVLLVPRYPGRVADKALREAFGHSLAITDRLPEDGSMPGLTWVNRMGVLAEAYGRSAVGVVCGTFAPIGGHDLSEPLQQGAASIYGPHIQRQRALHLTLDAAGAATQVEDAADLPSIVAGLLTHPELAQDQRQRFAATVADADGRLDRLARELMTLVRAD